MQMLGSARVRECETEVLGAECFVESSGSARAQAQRPPGSLRLATPPVPGGLEFPSACAKRTGYGTSVAARWVAGRKMSGLPPSPGTGEGLRSKAQGEGATASDARRSSAPPHFRTFALSHSRT